MSLNKNAEGEKKISGYAALIMRPAPAADAVGVLCRIDKTIKTFLFLLLLP